MPVVKGLNFDETDAFIVESSENMDTILYWIKDTAIWHMDTLELAITYKELDSLGNKVARTDTNYVAARKSRERVLKEQQEAYEKAEKAFQKAAKKRKDYDENNPPEYVPPTKELKIKSRNSSTMDLNVPYRIGFDEPVISIDTSFIHVQRAVNDSTYEDIPFVFRSSDKKYREYIIYAEWRPEEVYRVRLDSAMFHGLYGGTSRAFEEKMRFRSLDEYAVLFLNIPGTGNNAIVQLMKSDKNVVDEQRTENGRCSFYFIKPDKYYLRLIMDENGNGKWDTGDYGKHLAPEKVYYYPKAIEMRALFEYSLNDWDINELLDKQKPLEITKQKPDKERKKRNRNAQRKFK